MFILVTVAILLGLGLIFLLNRSASPIAVEKAYYQPRGRRAATVGTARTGAVRAPLFSPHRTDGPVHHGLAPQYTEGDRHHRRQLPIDYRRQLYRPMCPDPA